MSEVQTSMLGALYQKDNVRLSLHKKARVLYNFSRFVYSRLEEYPESTEKESIVKHAEDIMYSMGAIMVVVNPDGNVDSLKTAYNEAESFDAPKRYTYMYPKIEELRELTMGFQRSIDEFATLKKRYFTEPEADALGRLFDIIDENILFLMIYLKDGR
jgi:hypothetical protein